MNDKVFLVMLDNGFGDEVVASAHKTFESAHKEGLNLNSGAENGEFYWIDTFVLED